MGHSKTNITSFLLILSGTHFFIGFNDKSCVKLLFRQNYDVLVVNFLNSAKDSRSEKEIQILNALATRVRGRILPSSPATTQRNIQLKTSFTSKEIKEILVDLEAKGEVQSQWGYFILTPKGRKRLKQGALGDL